MDGMERTTKAGFGDGWGLKMNQGKKIKKIKEREAKLKFHKSFCDMLRKSKVHATSLSTTDNIHVSSLNTWDNMRASVLNTSDTMHAYSLTTFENMHVPYPNSTQNNMLASSINMSDKKSASSLNTPENMLGSSLNTTDNHSNNGFQLQASNKDGNNKIGVMFPILALNEDHPMLSSYVPMNHPPNSMISSSTRNFLQHSNIINNLKSKDIEALKQDLHGQMPMDYNAFTTMNPSTHGYCADYNMSISSEASTHGLCTDNNSRSIYNGGVNGTSMGDNGRGFDLSQSTGQNDGSNLSQAKGHDEGFNFNSSNALERQARTPSNPLIGTSLAHAQQKNFPNAPLISAAALFEKAAKIASSLGNKSYTVYEPYQSNHIQQPMNSSNGGKGSSSTTPLVGSLLNSNLCSASSSSSSKMKLPPPVSAPSMSGEPNQRNHIQQHVNYFNGGEGSSSATNFFGSLMDSNHGGTSYSLSSASFGIIPSPPSTIFSEPDKRNYIQRPMSPSNGIEGSLRNPSLFGVNICTGRTSAPDGLTRNFLGDGKSVDKKCDDGKGEQYEQNGGCE